MAETYADQIDAVARAIAEADGEDYMEDSKRYDARARAAIAVLVPSKGLYDVWLVPTEHGAKAFGWAERLVCANLSKEDADFEAWSRRNEEAPDFCAFGSYCVRPALLKALSQEESAHG